jgi:hypothetical protein
VTLFTATSTATTNAGDVDYCELGKNNAASAGSDGSVLNIPNAENFPIIWPGQDIAIVTDGAGAAGVCTVFMEYEELPFNATEIDANNGTPVVRKLTVS